MANSLLPTPNLLLQMQKRSPFPLAPPLPPCRSIGKRTIHRTHRLSHQSLNPSSGQNHVVVPAPSPTPTPALASRAFHSPSAPEGGAEHDVRPIWRDPGGGDATRTGPASGRAAPRRRGSSLGRLDGWGGRGRGQRGGRQRGHARGPGLRSYASYDPFRVASLSSEVPSSSSSAKEFFEASSSSSSRSAAGIPRTPSANSNSVSTYLPLLPFAPSSSSSSSSASSRRGSASSSKSTALTCACPTTPHALNDFAVGRPVKDMMREELEQEQELNNDLNLDLDSDIEDEAGIIAWIQVRVFPTTFAERWLMHWYRRTSLVKMTISSAPKLASRDTASSGAIHNGKFEVVLDDFITEYVPHMFVNSGLARSSLCF
ncbi:hypothetical protein EDB85DRAFT_747547 [Lactarius pseudohatsudake]|nr:hypothetical protein EDB85DRAFT_747547 [Lactarius pseudohatsudake]